MIRLNIQGNLLNRTEALEAGRAKIDLSNVTKPYVIEEYHSGNSRYRIWSHGLIEQWGLKAAANGNVTISLLKPFSSTSYNIETSILGTNPTTFYSEVISGQTTSYFTVYQNVGASYGLYIFWYASGY